MSIFDRKKNRMDASDAAEYLSSPSAGSPEREEETETKRRFSDQLTQFRPYSGSVNLLEKTSANSVVDFRVLQTFNMKETYASIAPTHVQPTDANTTSPGSVVVANTGDATRPVRVVEPVQTRTIPADLNITPVDQKPPISAEGTLPLSISRVIPIVAEGAQPPVVAATTTFRTTDAQPLRTTDAQPLGTTDVQPLRTTDAQPLRTTDAQPLSLQTPSTTRIADAIPLPLSAQTSHTTATSDARPLVFTVPTTSQPAERSTFVPVDAPSRTTDRTVVVNPLHQSQSTEQPVLTVPPKTSGIGVGEQTLTVLTNLTRNSDVPPPVLRQATTSGAETRTENPTPKVETPITGSIGTLPFRTSGAETRVENPIPKVDTTASGPIGTLPFKRSAESAQPQQQPQLEQRVSEPINVVRTPVVDTSKVVAPAVSIETSTEQQRPVVSHSVPRVESPVLRTENLPAPTASTIALRAVNDMTAGAATVLALGDSSKLTTARPTNLPEATTLPPQSSRLPEVISGRGTEISTIPPVVTPHRTESVLPSVLNNNSQPVDRTSTSLPTRPVERGTLPVEKNNVPAERLPVARSLPLNHVDTTSGTQFNSGKWQPDGVRVEVNETKPSTPTTTTGPNGQPIETDKTGTRSVPRVPTETNRGAVETTQTGTTGARPVVRTEGVTEPRTVDVRNAGQQRLPEQPSQPAVRNDQQVTVKPDAQKTTPVRGAETPVRGVDTPVRGAGTPVRNDSTVASKPTGKQTDVGTRQTEVTPVAARTEQPATAKPVNRSSDVQARPDATTQVKPVINRSAELPTPVRSDSGQPVRPASTTPVRPESTPPARSESTPAVRSESTQPVRPASTTPVRPESATPVRAEPTTPVRQQSAIPARAESPVRGESTTPVRPDSQARPESTTTSKPAGKATTPDIPVRTDAATSTKPVGNPKSSDIQVRPEVVAPAKHVPAATSKGTESTNKSEATTPTKPALKADNNAIAIPVKAAETNRSTRSENGTIKTTKSEVPGPTKHAVKAEEIKIQPAKQQSAKVEPKSDSVKPTVDIVKSATKATAAETVKSATKAAATETVKPATKATAAETVKSTTKATAAETVKSTTKATAAETVKSTTKATAAETVKPTNKATAAETVKPATKATAADTVKTATKATASDTVKPATKATAAETVKSATKATATETVKPTTKATPDTVKATTETTKPTTDTPKSTVRPQHDTKAEPKEEDKPAKSTKRAESKQPERGIHYIAGTTEDSIPEDEIPLVPQLDRKPSASASSDKSPKPEKKQQEAPAPLAGIIDRTQKPNKRRKVEKSEERPIKEVRVAPQQRTKYIVKPGDTLQSIAQSELKDARFAYLILTINRGRISFVTKFGKQEPLLRVGQVLWLPTQSEREAYAKAVFSTKRKSISEVALMNPTSHIPVPVPSSMNLDRIRRANQPQQIALHQIDYQLNQSKLLNKLNNLAQNISTSVWFAGSPADAAEQPEKKGPSTQQPRAFDQDKATAASQIIEKLAASCRVVTTNGELADDFNAALEIEIGGEWTTIACYEYHRGHGYRYNYYSKENSKPFPMDLPLSVVLEMAKEDFRRNWSTYCHEFSRQKERSFS